MGVVLDALGKIHNKIRNKIGGFSITSSSEPVGKPAPEDLEEKYQEKIGELEAKLAKKEEKLKEREEEKSKEFAKRVELTREKLQMEGRKKYKPFNGIPRYGPVLSKDHTLLGFYEDHIYTEDGKIGIVVNTREDGKGTRFVPFQAKSMETLYHHSESISSMLETGIHILNITEGGKYSPDVDLEVSANELHGVEREGGDPIKMAKEMLLDTVEEMDMSPQGKGQYRSMLENLFSELKEDAKAKGARTKAEEER